MILCELSLTVVGWVKRGLKFQRIDHKTYRQSGCTEICSNNLGLDDRRLI